jgi:hypothetical protein
MWGACACSTEPRFTANLEEASPPTLPPPPPTLRSVLEPDGAAAAELSDLGSTGAARADSEPVVPLETPDAAAREDDHGAAPMLRGEGGAPAEPDGDSTAVAAAAGSTEGCVITRTDDDVAVADTVTLVDEAPTTVG